MKVSSAFIRATQAQNVSPDPWEPVERSNWTGGTIYPRWKTSFQFKFKRHIAQGDQWIPQDEWLERTYTGMTLTRVADTGNGALIRAGDYQGMIPGLYYPDDTNININNVHVTEYMLSADLGSGNALTNSTLTYLEGTPDFYLSGYGLEPGTYKLDIIRYYGRPQLYHYNGNLAQTIVVEGIKTTHESYGANDNFYFDPEVKEFDGYQTEGQAPFRKGHVVTLTEEHIFKVEHTYDQIVLNSIGLQTFCDGIRYVNYDLDGETETHGYQIGQEPMIYLIDFNLYRLK